MIPIPLSLAFALYIILALSLLALLSFYHFFFKHSDIASFSPSKHGSSSQKAQKKTKK